MPRLSARQRALKELMESVALALLLEEDEIADDFLLAYAEVEELTDRSYKYVTKAPFGCPGRVRVDRASKASKARRYDDED